MVQSRSLAPIQIRTSPVTPRLTEEVVKPFSAAMEQVVRDTIKDALATNNTRSTDSGKVSGVAMQVILIGGAQEVDKAEKWPFSSHTCNSVNDQPIWMIFSINES